jgi:hypothetical protein
MVLFLLGCPQHFAASPAVEQKDNAGENMESAEVVRIATAVLREYGVPLSLASVSMAPGSGWIVSFKDIHSGNQQLSVATRCDGSASPYRLRESLKARLAVED